MVSSHDVGVVPTYGDAFDGEEIVNVIVISNSLQMMSNVRSERSEIVVVVTDVVLV